MVTERGARKQTGSAAATATGETEQTGPRPSVASDRHGLNDQIKQVAPSRFGPHKLMMRTNRSLIHLGVFAGLLFVLPGVAALLPTSMQNAINPYLPSVVAGTIMSGNHDAHTFSAWGGFALFCGYIVVTFAIALVALARRDA